MVLILFRLPEHETPDERPREYAIDLLNVTDKDGWINIPAEANDVYIASLIDLIKNGGDGAILPMHSDGGQFSLIGGAFG